MNGSAPTARGPAESGSSFGTSAGECLKRGWKVLPRVFLVTLLYGIIVGLGYVLLIVPGVIFSLMFAVSVPAAVVEGLDDKAA